MQDSLNGPYHPHDAHDAGDDDERYRGYEAEDRLEEKDALGLRHSDAVGGVDLENTESLISQYHSTLTKYSTPR